MSSFQALLSTALSGSYSQGLIHRKTTQRLFQSTKKNASEGSLATKKPMEGSAGAIVRERNRG